MQYAEAKLASCGTANAKFQRVTPLLKLNWCRPLPYTPVVANPVFTWVFFLSMQDQSLVAQEVRYPFWCLPGNDSHI